jgi:hypothetical protein
MSGGIGGGESGVPETLLDTKGQIHGFSTSNSAVSVSGNDGYLLTEDSTNANGIAWKTLTTADSVLTTQGDILYENSSGLARLGFGTSGDVLTTKGTGANPVWETPSGLSSPLTSNLVWNDNVEANFGTGGGDSRIYHDGSNLYMKAITGKILIASDGGMQSGNCWTGNQELAVISSGQITGTTNTHTVATEGGASTDDLDGAVFTASGVSGSRFVLLAQNSSNTVVVKDTTGSVQFLMNGDFSLDNGQDTITFEAISGFTHNYELCRSDNAS